MMNSLYAAYGTNMNKLDMKFRAPTAVPVGKGFVIDHILRYRTWPVCEPDVGNVCPVGVYNIDDEAEKALDVYEGYPDLYRKEIIIVPDFGECLIYMMQPDMFPYESFNSIKAKVAQGYADFNLTNWADIYGDKLIEYGRDWIKNFSEEKVLSTASQG